MGLDRYLGMLVDEMFSGDHVLLTTVEFGLAPLSGSSNLMRVSGAAKLEDGTRDSMVVGEFCSCSTSLLSPGSASAAFWCMGRSAIASRFARLGILYGEKAKQVHCRLR